LKRLTLRPGRRLAELSDVRLPTSELDELTIAYIKQERSALAGLFDLLESSARVCRDDQEKIARVREKLAKIDALLAALGVKPSVSRH
jgi:hypothetical protein